SFPQTVTIPAGSTTQSAGIAIVNDSLSEGNETINLGISASANYTLGSPSSETIIIVDDDNLPDLTVGVSGPSTDTVGTPYSYALNAGNIGSSAASGVTVQFTLPSGVTYNSAAGSGFSVSQSAGVVTFSGGSIANGASATLNVTVTPTATGTVTLPAGAA